MTRDDWQTVAILMAAMSVWFIVALALALALALAWTVT